jgi:hypothetical protein
MNEDTFTYPELDQGYKESYVYRLIKYLTSIHEEKLAKLLEYSCCDIIISEEYARKRSIKWRWNVKIADVCFYVPVDALIGLDQREKNVLLNCCNDLIDNTYGYAVLDIKIIPDSDSDGGKKLSREISRIQEKAKESVSLDILPKDVLDNGKEMTEAYLYLYCIENSLRIFVEKVGIEKLGASYFDKLKGIKSIKKGIEIRKEKEKSHKWMGSRGLSDIFYTDFSDLGNIIINNWEIYKEYFGPHDLHNVETKISELAECRNLVAHNSYLNQTGCDLISIHYRTIIPQLEK